MNLGNLYVQVSSLVIRWSFRRNNILSLIFPVTTIYSVCICLPLPGPSSGSLYVGFHTVTCTIRPFDLQKWPAQLNRAQWVHYIVPLSFYYFVFYILLHCYSLVRIFSSVSFFRKFLTFLHIILSCLKCCFHSELLI